MTEPSDKALDKAAAAVGYDNWMDALDTADSLELGSIRAHACALDELEAVKAELAALKGKPDPYVLGLREVLARWHFKYHWTDHHGPASWDANPWVVALTFETIMANIEEVK